MAKPDWTDFGPAISVGGHRTPVSDRHELMQTRECREWTGDAFFGTVRWRTPGAWTGRMNSSGW